MIVIRKLKQWDVHKRPFVYERQSLHLNYLCSQQEFMTRAGQELQILHQNFKKNKILGMVKNDSLQTGIIVKCDPDKTTFLDFFSEMFVLTKSLCHKQDVMQGQFLCG